MVWFREYVVGDSFQDYAPKLLNDLDGNDCMIFSLYILCVAAILQKCSAS